MIQAVAYPTLSPGLFPQKMGGAGKALGTRLWLTLIGRESDRINTLNIASVFKGLKTVTSDSPCIPGATPCTFSQGPRTLVAFETLTVLQKLPCTKQPQ